MTYQRNETPEPLASGVLSAFEEMMPEPAFAPTEGLLAGMPLYTADQLRTAMQAAWDAATERAAKVVEFGEPPLKPTGGRVEIGDSARKAFATAIRSSGRGEG